MTNSKTINITTNFRLLSFIVLFIACSGQNKTEKANDSAAIPITAPMEKNYATAFGTNGTTEIDNNIRSIFQDKNNNYWFGTNGTGVFRYDGKTITQYTEKEGLADNQVQSIQEDKSGNIWFGTGAFGVSRFDGKTFSTLTNKETTIKEWKNETDDLWFCAGGGAYRYNNNSFFYLPLPKTGFDTKYSQNPPHRLSSYAVYCSLKDSKGTLWFGTQSMGVCSYDGKTFTWFTEKGLAGPAVLGLFEDRNGNLWFGNNGSGLFRYDGKTLTNLTTEKGLANDEFRKSGKSVPGTLARIYSINQDNNGDLWIGTVDAGVWRYDGNNFTNYTTKDGLTSNAVNVIYKDKKGELWFGTDGDGICRFNGKFFTKFSVK
jgi:ligand-binding sensor domain-containing protein